MSAAELILDGDLSFVVEEDQAEFVNGESFYIEAMDGAEFGDPVTIVAVMESLLRDGSIVSDERDENRTVSFPVRITGTNSLGRAQGEARLARATHKRTTLSWTAPDGESPATVFEVLTSSLTTPAFDILDENRNQRMFQLTLTCEPYAHSANLTTEVAGAIPSVGTVVNGAESLSGWSTPAAVVPGPTDGTYVTASPQPSNMLALDTTTKVEGASSVAAKSWKIYSSRNSGFLPSGEDGRQTDTSLTLTQAITIPAGAYISFAVKFDSTFGRPAQNYNGQTSQRWGTLETFTMTTASTSRTYRNKQTAQGQFLLSSAIVDALPDGWKRYTFRIDTAMSVTSLNWTSEHLVPYNEDVNAQQRPRILVDQVAVAESATLGNQILQTIPVGGTARATGSLHVAAPSDSVALGNVLAYTIPKRLVADGWRPDLYQWIQPGATLNTSFGRSNVFGFGNAYGTAGSATFVQPAANLRTGSYRIALDIYSTTVNALSGTMEASLIVGGTVVYTEETPLASAALVANKWQIVVLQTAQLPPAPIFAPTANATVRIRFKFTNSPSTSNVYLMPVEGDLSVVNAGTGTVGPNASSHVWIDAPSADQPQGGYWRGATPDRTNATSAWRDVIVPGQHVMESGEMYAFAATEASGARVLFDYYKPWRGSAAE